MMVYHLDYILSPMESYLFLTPELLKRLLPMENDNAETDMESLGRARKSDAGRSGIPWKERERRGGTEWKALEGAGRARRDGAECLGRTRESEAGRSGMPWKGWR